MINVLVFICCGSAHLEELGRENVTAVYTHQENYFF